jgi:hypothetical protein
MTDGIGLELDVLLATVREQLAQVAQELIA